MSKTATLLLFVAAAVVIAAGSVTWAFGRRSSPARRAAGLLGLIVVGGWAAGPAGLAVRQAVPGWVGSLQAWARGGGADGTQGP